jgi:hypothetical protein
VHIYGVTRQGIQGCVVLVVAVLVVLAPALFTGRVLAPEDNIYFEPPFDGLRAPLGLERPSNPELFDQYRQLHPDMLLARQELHSGELPGWNPFAGAGDPVWASEQHGVASPFEWPAMVLPFWQSLEWVAALKLLAAAVGMFLLLRRLGRSQPASVLGALAFALSSPIIDWLGHPHTNSYVLLPWLFLTIDLVASEGRWRDVVLLAATTGACMAGGHAPSAVMVAYISAAWAVFRFATAPNPRRMALFAGGVVLGVGLAAVAVLPAVELSQHAGSAERNARGSLQTLYSFVVPDYWGRPDRVHTAASRVNYVERTGYFGTVPLILAAVGLAVRRPRRVQLFFIGLTLVSLAFAIKTPLSSLASHLPLMSHVRLVRWVFGAAFGGAALAAFGLDAICERRPSPRVVGFVATLLLLPLLVLSVRHGLADAADTASALAGTAAQPVADAVRTAAVVRWTLFGALAVAALVLVTRRKALGNAAAVVVAAAGVELVAFSIGFQPAISRARVDPPAVAPVAYARAHVGHERVGGGWVFGPNLAQRFGLRDARIYRSPPLRRRQDLWTALGGLGTDYALMSSSASRLADLFAVKYVFVENSRSTASGHFRPVPGVPGLVENVGAFPRAWLAYRWRSARDAHRALSLVAGHRDLKAQPVIETPAHPDVAVPQAPDAVRFERDGMQEVTLRLNARAPGQLILGDMFYPGWKAFVDGHQTPIHAANVAFRAVAVPRGRHTVRFRYQPAVLAVGLWTSVASLLLIVLISIWLGMRRRRVAAGHRREEMLNPTATLTNRDGSPQAEAIPQPHE